MDPVRALAHARAGLVLIADNQDVIEGVVSAILDAVEAAAQTSGADVKHIADAFIVPLVDAQLAVLRDLMRAADHS